MWIYLTKVNYILSFTFIKDYPMQVYQTFHYNSKNYINIQNICNYNIVIKEFYLGAFFLDCL